MAEVSFYQLSRGPVDRVVPRLAAKAFERGGQVLVVHEEREQRSVVSYALWASEGAFLAHGTADAPHADRQPLLLSDDLPAATGGMAIIADGKWRQHAADWDRVLLLFGPDQTEAARELWGSLSSAGHRLRIFKQRENGGWREGR